MKEYWNELLFWFALAFGVFLVGIGFKGIFKVALPKSAGALGEALSA